MATSFSTAKTSLDQIADRIQSNRRKLQQAQAWAAEAEADLTAMPAAYGTVIADIDAAVVAAPGDTALVNLKAEKDKLVAEFNALKPAATSMKNATAAVAV